MHPVAPAMGVAASTRVRDLLLGPAREAVVLADFPSAAYLAVGDRLLAVLTPRATRLPCAVLVPDALPALGSSVRVGGGGLDVAGTRLPVTRWWAPPRPRPVRSLPSYAASVQALAALRPESRSGAEPGRVAGLRAALVTSGAEGAPLDPSVSALVGRGPGLTPAGDDVLAGALLATVGQPIGARLAIEVQAAVPRTTALAGQLLRDAAAGFGAPEAVGLVDAVRGHGPVEPALRRLLAVGHTSGADTAVGILVGALAHLRGTQPERREEGA